MLSLASLDNRSFEVCLRTSRSTELFAESKGSQARHGPTWDRNGDRRVRCHHYSIALLHSSAEVKTE